MPRRKTIPSDVKVGEKLTFAAEPVEWIEAAADDGDKPPKFAMTAYTGGAMHVGYYFSPVVLDLTGIKAQAESVPVLLGHDDTHIVGHGEASVTARTIKIAGLVSGGGPSADEVVTAAKRGFPWKASVGIMPNKTEFVEQGATAKANGRLFKGPVNIVRGGTLLEVSFVPIAADGKTRVSVAASNSGAKNMDPKLREWIEAKGFNPDELAEEQVAGLQASYDLENAEPEPTPEPSTPLVVAAGGDGAAELDEYRKTQAAESRRVADVREVCAGQHAPIEAKAIEDGWSKERAELEVLRASRPKAPAGHVSSTPVLNNAVIEAAACRTLGIGDLEKDFDSKTIEAADKAFKREIGLQEILLVAAQANGYEGRNFRKSDARQILQAAFSTMDIAGIMGNVANKSLLAAFMAVEAEWREITTIGSLPDFKTMTRYRLTGDLTYEEVGPGGEIKHGTADEESYTITALTYAKMFGLTRQDIINDDLGALSIIPRRLGRGAAIRLNKKFWTVFLDNSTFFATANNNYVAGAAYALSSAGLAKAVETFRKITDADGERIGLTPKILLVPPELEITAQELFISTNLNTGGAATTEKVPNRNVFAGKYRPVVSGYLSDSNYTGYLTTGYYLLADPADMPTMEVGFLNGNQAPTVESADADFNTLGIQFRGYHDFGVAQANKYGGVKMKGAT